MIDNDCLIPGPDPPPPLSQRGNVGHYFSIYVCKAVDMYSLSNHSDQKLARWAWLRHFDSET